jgi:hypothetical protein
MSGKREKTMESDKYDALAKYQKSNTQPTINTSFTLKLYTVPGDFVITIYTNTTGRFDSTNLLPSHFRFKIWRE